MMMGASTDLGRAARRGLAGLALFAAVLAVAPAASAQAEGATATVLFSSPAIAVVGTVFLVADIAYAAEGRLLPHEWAIAQLVGAVLELAFGATALIGIAQGSAIEGPLAGFAAAGLVTGVWHAAHSIASLDAGDEPDRPSDEVPSVRVSLLEGGGVVMIAGAF